MEVLISFAEVQAALQRCLAANPPVNVTLCRDASLLADVFGEMLFFREQERSLAPFSEDHRAAFARWHQVR
jgi:hypothetical protein